MKRKKTLTWALISLVLFWIVNVIMTLPVMRLTVRVSVNGLIRTSAIAAIMYLIPMILVAFRSRLGYYLLAAVQVIYTIGLIAAIIAMITISRAGWPLKIAVIVLVIVAIMVNVYWFTIAYQVRKATTKERVAHYMKFRK